MRPRPRAGRARFTSVRLRPSELRPSVGPLKIQQVLCRRRRRRRRDVSRVVATRRPTAEQSDVALNAEPKLPLHSIIISLGFLEGYSVIVTTV